MAQTDYLIPDLIDIGVPNILSDMMLWIDWRS